MSELLNGNVEEPLRYNLIDLNNMIYTKTKKSIGKETKKIILTKYKYDDANKNMVFQTPILTCISKTKNEQNINELEISFENKNNKIIEFINFLTELENKVKKDANIFASQWFENISNENNTVNFQKIIRTNPNYPDGLLKMKIVNNNDFVTQLFNEQNKKISFENIKINSKCKLLIEVYSIWVQNSSSGYDFGIYLRPVLIKFVEQEKPKPVYNYKLIENSESETDIDDVPDTDVNPNRKEEDSIMEMNSIFMKPKEEKQEMPLLETIYQTDNIHTDMKVKIDYDKEKSFINVLTELNPELLSKNYSETSDEELFIQSKKEPINACLSNETSDSETSDEDRNAERSFTG